VQQNFDFDQTQVTNAVSTALYECIGFTFSALYLGGLKVGMLN
jgi:hypothetical protein